MFLFFLPQDSFRCHYVNGIKQFEYRCGFGDNDIIAPTQEIVMRWLRKVYKISIRPRYDEVEDENEHIHYVWFYDILSMKPYKILKEIEQGYNTYENACESAIKYCLENLIN